MGSYTGLPLPEYIRRANLLALSPSEPVNMDDRTTAEKFDTTMPNMPQMPNPVSTPSIAPTTIAPAPNINDMPFHKKYSDVVPNLAPYPERQDYQAGKVRRIVGLIAGGLGGAAGHPEYGNQIVNQPYNTALTDWKNKASTIAPLMSAEDEQAKLDSSRNIAQGRIEGSRNISQANLSSKSDVANMKLGEFGIGEFRRKIADSEKARHNREVEDAKKRELEDKEKNPKQGSLAARLADVDNAIAEYKKANPTATDEQAKAAVRDKIINAYPVNDPDLIRRKAEAVIAPHVAETKAKLEAGLAPDIVDKEVEKAKKMEAAKAGDVGSLIDTYNKTAPDVRPQMLSSISPKERTEMYKAGIVPTRKLNAQEQTQVDNSRVALNHVDTLRGLLKDPFVQQHLGALAGRIALVKQTIGGKQYETYVVKGNSISGDEKEQQFLTSAAQLLNWEVKNIAGNRPAHQLFDRLAKTAPGVTKSKEANEGSLAAIEKSITNVLDGYNGIVHTENKGNKPVTDYNNKYKVVEVK